MPLHKATRLTLVISSLQGGGAERVMSVLANAWVEQGCEVQLITFSRPQDREYALNRRVVRHWLSDGPQRPGRLGALVKLVRDVLRLRAELTRERPDLVVSFMDVTNVLTLLASYGTPVPVVVSERVDPEAQPLSLFWKTLRRLTYPSARAVVVQSNKVRDWARAFVNPARVFVIPNPVKDPGARSRRESTAHRPFPKLILGMGRLVQQKGFDLLLQAFALVAARYPEWNLLILGEGEARSQLEKLVQELGLSGRVSLPGFVVNPAKFLVDAEVFVLSSRYEGFPNALCEAMACGLPVISFACPSGPDQIISHNSDGLLVPPENVMGLAEAMETLMQDQALRERLGSKAKGILERYSLPRVLELWGSLWSVGPERDACPAGQMAR